MLFSLYPYHNFNDYNLDWVIQMVKKLAKELEVFVNINTIKYADPIEWNIETQYEANTVVIDKNTGDAYLSTKPVPSGVSIKNEEYWTPIFNYSKNIDDFKHNIVDKDNGIENNAIQKYKTGDVFWWNNLLWVATKDIERGTTLIDDFNVKEITFEEYISNLFKIQSSVTEMVKTNYPINTYVCALGYYGAGDKGGGYYHIEDETPDTYYVTLNNGKFARLITPVIATPQMFGAVGDGETDDSDAFKELLSGKYVDVLIPKSEYNVNDIIIVNENINIEDNGIYTFRKPVWKRGFDLDNFALFGLKKEYEVGARNYVEGIAYDDRRNVIYVGTRNYVDSNNEKLDIYTMHPITFNILDHKEFNIAAIASLTYDSISDVLYVTTTGSGSGRTNALYPISLDDWTLGDAVITPDDNQFVSFDPKLKTFIMFYINSGNPNTANVRVYNHEMTETIKSFNISLSPEDTPQQGVCAYDGHIYTVTFYTILEIDYVAETFKRIKPIPSERGFEEIEDFAVDGNGKILAVGHRSGVDGIERIYEYGFSSYENLETITPPVVIVDLRPLTEDIVLAPGEQTRTPDYVRPTVEGYRIVDMVYADISGPGAGNLLMNGSLAGTSISIYNPHATATLTLTSLLLRFVFVREDVYRGDVV